SRQRLELRPPDQIERRGRNGREHEQSEQTQQDWQRHRSCWGGVVRKCYPILTLPGHPEVSVEIAMGLRVKRTNPNLQRSWSPREASPGSLHAPVSSFRESDPALPLQTRKSVVRIPSKIQLHKLDP